MKEFDELIEIMARLRGRDGCSWDREQTHESLLPYLIEESHETLDALESGNAQWACEELGDLLLQIVFHCRIAEEEGDYTIRDVVEGLSAKLVRRHPHVFGDAVFCSTEEFEKKWAEIKAREKEGKSYEESASPSLIRRTVGPALLRKKGVSPPRQELRAEFAGDCIARFAGGPQGETALGELLLALLFEAERLEIDPDRALWKAIKKHREPDM